MPNINQVRKAQLAALGDTTGAKNIQEFWKKSIAAQTASTYTDTKARNAIKTKTQVNALSGASTAADIVTALKA